VMPSPGNSTFSGWVMTTAADEGRRGTAPDC
jgi:hypothetical protein